MLQGVKTVWVFRKIQLWLSTFLLQSLLATPILCADNLVKLLHNMEVSIQKLFSAQWHDNS